MMRIRNLWMLAVAGMLLGASAQPAACQHRVEIPSDGPGFLEFSYAWTGGITVDEAGAIRMREHPRVTAVRAGSGAASAGLRPGDVILRVDGRDALDPAALRDVRPGSRILLVVRRGDDELRIAVQTRRQTAR